MFLSFLLTRNHLFCLKFSLRCANVVKILLELVVSCLQIVSGSLMFLLTKQYNKEASKPTLLAQNFIFFQKFCTINEI